MTDTDDFTDYSIAFEDMTPAEQQKMFDEINRDRREMKMPELKSFAEVTRKHAQPTLAQIEATDTSVRTRYATPGQKCGRGRVRVLSDKQINFIKFLMVNRDTTNLVRLPGSEDLEFMSLKGASDLIDRLLKCPVKAGQPTVRMATEKQISYALSLTERKMGIDKRNAVEATAKAITAADISKIIDKLKAMPDLPVAPTNTPTTKEEIKELAGIYELEGSIYRMKKARNGQHFYAELLIDEESGAWEYARGMARKVPEQGRKLSLEECEALSALTGSCCMCSRELTATVDGVGPAARYVGPICARKMGF